MLSKKDLQKIGLKMPKSRRVELLEQLELFKDSVFNHESLMSADLNKHEMLQRLRNACYVCCNCGIAFSEPYQYSAAVFATFHQGACDVCEGVTAVTSVRDFGYLLYGIKKIEGALIDERSSAGRQVPKPSVSEKLVGDFMNLCDRKGV